MTDKTQDPCGSDSSAELGLTERMRASAGGYDEWRVQHPKDKSFCFSKSWPESINSEREVREWFDDHKKRFHDSMFAGYEVAKVRVVPNKDALLIEAAKVMDRMQLALLQIANGAPGPKHIAKGALEP